MGSPSTLAIVAKAKDEVSGPMKKVEKTFNDAARALEMADQRVASAEKKKRQATDEARQAQALAARQAQEFSKSVGSLGGAVSALVRNLGGLPVHVALVNQAFEVGKSAAMALGGAISGAFRGTIAAVQGANDASSKFGLKIAQVASIVDDADNVTEDLRKAVLRLSGTYGAAPVEQATALYEAVSAGATKASEAISLLTVANKVAVAGQASVPDAIDGLTTAINAFGAGMDEALPFADAFFVAVRDGKMTVSQLAKSLGTVVGNARSAGITFDELAAGIATITLAGNTADESTTALNQALASVIAPTKMAREEAERLGIEFNKAAITKAGGFGKFLQGIDKNAKKTGESIARLFGDVRSMKAVNALLLNEGETFGRLFDNMSRKAGATDTALDRITGTLEFQRMRFESLKQTATIALGDMTSQSEGLVGAYEGANDVVSIFVRKMTDAKFVVGGNRVEMRKFVREGVADFVGGFAKVIRMIPISTKLLGFFGDAAKSVIMASPLGKFLRDAATGMRVLGEASKGLGGLREIAEAVDPSISKAFGELFDGGEDVAKFFDDYAAGLRGTAEEAENLKTEQEKLVASYLADLKKMRAEEAASLKVRNEEEAKANEKKAKDAREKSWDVAIDYAKSRMNEVNLAARIKKLQKNVEAKDEKDRKAKLQRDEKEAEDAAKRLATTIENASSAIASSLAGGFWDAIKGARSFEDYVKDMLDRLALSVLESGLKAGISALFTGLTGGAGAGGGGILKGILSFFGFARGGVVGTTSPKRFATGGIVSGPAGTDNVPAVIMGRYGLQPARLSDGEGVIPPDVTDGLRRALRVPGPASTSTARAASSPTFNIVINGAGGSTDRMIRDELIPGLRRAWSAGQLDFMRT